MTDAVLVQNLDTTGHSRGKITQIFGLADRNKRAVRQFKKLCQFISSRIPLKFQIFLRAIPRIS
jgi:hypothetical protein